MAELFDSITDREKTLIKDFIYNNIETGYMSESLEYILRIWEQNKPNLFKIFGNKLILSKEVVYPRPKDQILRDMEDFLYGDNEFLGNYRSFLNDAYKNYEWSIWESLTNLTRGYTLVDNKYSGDSFTIPNTKISIKNGEKAIRALGKIAKEFDIEGFEDFRIQHSMFLNQKELKGTLCLSIHPLDYMTMSDNNCNWSSCMSWENEGDYRQGTVEMMNSPCVVIAYLTSTSPYYASYGNEETLWSNKKWRELFIVTPELLLGIKGYPYKSEGLESICLDWLKELIQTNYPDFGKYFDTLSRVKNNTSNVVAQLGHTLYLNISSGYMYNDIYSTHNAYVSPDIPMDYSLCYSGEAECMDCGEIIHCDEVPTCSLTCGSCGGYEVCDYCGDRIHPADEYYEVDDMRLCYDCYDEQVRSCAFSDEDHLIENMTEIYLVSFVDEDPHRLWNHNVIYVYNYYFENDFEEVINTLGYIEEDSNGDYYIVQDHLTKIGRLAFGIPTYNY